MLRVISHAGQMVDLDLEKLSTLRKIAPRTSRPGPWPLSRRGRPRRTRHHASRGHPSIAAGPEDVVVVALDDAVVDDVRVEVRQVQVGDGLDDQQDHHGGQLPGVRPEIGSEQPDHRRAPRSSGLGGAADPHLDGEIYPSGAILVERCERLMEMAWRTGLVRRVPRTRGRGDPPGGIVPSCSTGVNYKEVPIPGEGAPTEGSDAARRRDPSIQADRLPAQHDPADREGGDPEREQ